MSDQPNHDGRSCAFVALIGAPNAGKSTLINHLVGTKVSIVSHKVQTTRSLVRGISIVGDCQIVFVDTPGIFEPKRRLDRAMVSGAWSGAKDADIVALLIDTRKGLDDEVRTILKGLRDPKQPTCLLLNKIDLVKPEKLLQLAQAANEMVPFKATFMISALTGEGVPDFNRYLSDAAPAGPWMYPEDQISDLPMRQLAAEITREKIFHRLHQELPYTSTVETESWAEQKDGSVRIGQVVFVERTGHKKIILGKGGQTMKAIATAARKELMQIFERKVHLFVFVKVRDRWADDPERYREMGLEFPR